MACYNPIVFDKKSLFMQRISDHAIVGYDYYAAGQISIEKLPALCQKFDDLYGVGLKKDVRFKRKKLGLANAVLLLWQFEPGNIHFILMVQPGDNAAHKLEKLSNIFDKRIHVTGYELVQLPRKGNVKPSWTWKMTKENYRSWEIRIEQVTKSKNPKLASLAFFSLYKSPGFAGIRSQVGHLVKYWRGTWKRYKHKAEPFLAPQTLYYVSRLKDSGTKLSALTKQKAIANKIIPESIGKVSVTSPTV